MTDRPPLTVEIFRDADTPDISLDEVEAGIEAVRTIATGLQIVRKNRLVRIATPGADVVYPSKVRFARQSTDYNVVLTGRELRDDLVKDDDKVESKIAGMTYKRVSIITSTSIDVKLATQHETAHLLHLKRSGDAHDGDGHCTNEGCIMLANADVRPLYKFTFTQTRWDKVLRRPGTLHHEMVGIESERKAFCGECTQQLGMIAFYLQKLKAGEAIPPALFA